jgi:hypothetical protein
VEPKKFLRYSSAGRCYKFNCDDTVDGNKITLCSESFARKLNELCEPRQHPIEDAQNGSSYANMMSNTSPSLGKACTGVSSSSSLQLYSLSDSDDDTERA